MEVKNYNSLRNKLILPEYGRHIQVMVEHLTTIEDREERNRMAHNVIVAMGNLNTTLRDTSDFRHKLWDHLFILSNFKLDVDSPYEAPDSTMFEHKPAKLQYPVAKKGYKQYGKNVRSVIAAIKDQDDSPERVAAAISAAKFMKVKSYEYNKEYPSDEIIINDIKAFSDGKIVLDEDTLNSTKLNHRVPASKSKSILSKRKNVNTSQSYRRPNGTVHTPKMVVRQKSR